MKRYLSLLTIPLLTACSDSQVSQTQACLDNAACANKYLGAANISSIGGYAAAAGVPQVVGIGTSTQAGQVPSTSILPASVTNAQIQAQAAAIQRQLAAYDNGTTTALTTSPATKTISTQSASSPPSQVEIGVTRLEYGPEILR